LSAPIILIVVVTPTPATFVNFAAPAFVVLPIVIASALTDPEKVTTGGAAFSDALLFIT